MQVMPIRYQSYRTNHYELEAALIALRCGAMAAPRSASSEGASEGGYPSGGTLTPVTRNLGYLLNQSGWWRNFDAALL